MGPKDPISNMHFPVPVRRMAALPHVHSIELVKMEGMMMADFCKGGRKCLKS